MSTVTVASTRPAVRGPDVPTPAPAASATGARSEPGEVAPGRLAGLDGLRAIAVAAVVLFHLDVSVLPGGFLGVDVFFVISGFLITRLLLREIVQSGGLRLGRFYARRSRRLLPAVLALMLGVMTAGTWVWHDQLSTLRGSVLSSLTYVTNWWLIADHQSYFVASGRPPMLQHLWSLAIEEQYYVLWSALILLLTGLVGRSRRRKGLGLPRVAWVAALLAVASTAAMAVIAIRGDMPYGADTSRVYFGTDTHGMGLLLGSLAGACAVSRSTRRQRAVVTRLVWLSDAIAVGALAVLTWTFVSVDEFQPWLYRGGFLLVDAIALVVVCTIVRPGSGVGRLLELPLPRWIGQRSYAIYLWHWPVVVVTRPGIDVHGPILLLDAARLGLILALAAASYRFVEQPLRHRRPRPQPTAIRLPTRARILTALGVFAAAPCAVILVVAAHSGPTASGRPTAASRVAASHQPLGPTSARSARGRPSRARTAPSGGSSPVRAVSAFGDSVMLGAQSALAAKFSVHRFDAVEGRQAGDVLDDVDSARASGSLAPVVVIHLGNNGIISPDRLARTLSGLRDRHQVVLLTDMVPRDWQDPNNHTLREVSRRFANTTLIDWRAISAGHPDWFYDDGIHLAPVGAAAYAGLIVAALHP
ncbi:MAG: acetyltransferase [Pseudonocardiales bacterium]|nr:MAG: acetyltransferase [Pseudonocardiales bacterium]